MHQLFPHHLHDVGGGGCDQRGCIQNGFECHHPLAELSVLFPENQVTPVIEMLDRAVLGQSRGNFGDAAEHMGRAEAFVQPVEMRQAVQDRQNHGLRSHRRRNRRHGTVEIIGLAAEQDQIERLAAFGTGDGVHLGGIIAIGAFDPEALVA